MQKNKFVLFVAIPVCLNILMLGLYYSGHPFLQQIVSPKIEWLHHRSWREFGLLEQLQNIFLLAIVITFCAAVLNRKHWPERVFFLTGVLVIGFLLLEEIDYGIHFYEFYIGHESEIEASQRNWHNQEISGQSLTAYFKKISSAAMIFWFLLAPLLAGRYHFGVFAKIIPSRWFIIGFLISILFSRVAHFLDDAGLGVIDGIPGSLKGNISEFRETSTYYLYMLYAAQLYSTAELFSKRFLKRHADA